MYQILKRSPLMLHNYISGCLDIEIGVKQGHSLSPTLFGRIINDVSVVVSNIHVGFRSCDRNTKISILLYADNNVIFSKSKAEIQMVRNSLLSRWQHR